MKRFGSTPFVTALLGVSIFLWSSTSSQAQMSCIECHVDPSGGGMHGGFRGLSELTDDEVDVICMSCHDGSYTNPFGVQAQEAAVHENTGEYGVFKAGCRACHTSHSALLAGDGTSNDNLKMLGPEVVEASSTDGIARIRKPFINDVNGDNGGTGRKRYEDDIQEGWECNSGIEDDPVCIETDPPAAADGVRKLAFYLDTDINGTHWVSTSAPYIGACNTCHTRHGTPPPRRQRWRSHSQRDQGVRSVSRPQRGMGQQGRLGFSGVRAFRLQARNGP